MWNDARSDIEKKKEFESIAFQYMDSLYSTALRMTRDSIEAEDLVQDTYLRAYRFYDKFQPGTNFKAWIFKILTNTFINKYRKKVKAPQQIEYEKVEFLYSEEEKERMPDDDPDIDYEKYKELFDDKINEALAEISEEFRLVVLLCDVHGFSYKDIANIVNCPIGTVMSRLSRGRKQLQLILVEYATNEGYIRQKTVGKE